MVALQIMGDTSVIGGGLGAANCHVSGLASTRGLYRLTGVWFGQYECASRYGLAMCS